MVSLETPGAMIVPADFKAQIAPLIGAPFIAKGDSPDGWDCRGCARWIYRELLGVAVESYQDAYDASIVMTIAGRARRAQVIAERLAAWRPAEAMAGVLVQLSWLGRSGHVGVMIDRIRFVHADLGVGTTIADLSSPACPYRAVGFHLPGFVTEVVHG